MFDMELQAGSGVADITLRESVFLYGYPHVRRMSTGVHDPLLACALYLGRGAAACLFISADVIFVSKQTTARVRDRIARETGIAPASILVSATHTHSGPVTVAYVSNRADPVVPEVDPTYLRQLEDGLVEAGIGAWKSRTPAQVGVSRADATGIGTARHDPSGARDLDVPVLWARDARSHRVLGILLVCAMHPTVLHEDSTLISGDFPATARQYLQRRVADCPIVYHMGASGDQSPRHVVRGNTFDEAIRLGEILGRAVERSAREVEYRDDATLEARQRFVPLDQRDWPTAQDARARLSAARARLAQLQTSGAPATEIRTAECDCFGAEELLTLVDAAQRGDLDAAMRSILPAEIQAIRVGEHVFVGWPGEFFIEFALRVRKEHPSASIITLANGDLQGYVVTQQAVDQNWYEAGNALLKSPDAGDRIVHATLELLASMRGGADA